MHSGASWCILAYPRASWCILMHPGAFWCILVHSGPSTCILVHSATSWCVLVHPSASWYLLMHSGASWCILVHSGVSSCTLLHPGASWCILVHPGALWCILGCSSELPWALLGGCGRCGEAPARRPQLSRWARAGSSGLVFGLTWGPVLSFWRTVRSFRPRSCDSGPGPLTVSLKRSLEALFRSFSRGRYLRTTKD